VRKSLAIFCLGCVLGAVVAGGVFASLWRKAETARGEAEKAFREAEEQRQRKGQLAEFERLLVNDQVFRGVDAHDRTLATALLSFLSSAFCPLTYFLVWPRAKMLATKFSTSVALASL